MTRKEEILNIYKKILLLKRQNREWRDKNRLYFFNRPKEFAGGLGLPANPLQSELLEAWDNPVYKVFTYAGANRIGKTTILCIIALSMMRGRWLWSDKKIRFSHGEPRKIRLVGQDWHSHIKKTLIPDLKKWCPSSWKVSRKGNGIISDTDWIDYSTGSTLEIMSNKQDPDVFEGWNGDLIGYDEPPRQEVRNACAARLIDRQGRELFTMTLLKEAWVQTDVINATIEDGSPDPTIFSVEGEMTDNVGYGISQEAVDDFKHKYRNNPEILSARVHGKPSFLSGLVAKNFQRKTHIKGRFEIPLDWIIEIGIDVHPRKEQAVLFMGTDRKNQKWLFREIWGHGDGTWIGEEIIRVLNHHSISFKQVVSILIDPLAKADQNQGNTTYEKIEDVLFRYGLYLETGAKDKDSGILLINEYLMSKNKEPSLFVFRDLVRTIKEFEGWMYDKDTDKAQKVNDDMMENLYRLLLLETPYHMPQTEVYQKRTATAVTGY